MNAFTFNHVGSERKYGLELETSYCPNFRALQMSSDWGCKVDGSVQGMEFVSPILHGNKGLTRIRKFLQKADDYKFEVNRNCGYHLHLDCRKVKHSKLGALAIAYELMYPVYTKLVKPSREGNHYCVKRFDINDILRGGMPYIKVTARHGDWVSWSALHRHNSVEIRLHHGTLNPDTVINWIRIHTRFFDHFINKKGPRTVWKMFKDLDKKERFLYLAKKVWEKPDLINFYWTKRRQRLDSIDVTRNDIQALI
jgi:hypothetical protein